MKDETKQQQKKNEDASIEMDEMDPAKFPAGQVIKPIFKPIFQAVEVEDDP